MLGNTGGQWDVKVNWVQTNIKVVCSGRKFYNYFYMFIYSKSVIITQGQTETLFWVDQQIYKSCS
jgi:hypothetical protein